MKNDGVFIRARDLTGGIPLKDLHIHTRYSDGKSTIHDYIKSALQLGYEEICFTDHADFTTTWFDEYSREIASARASSNGMKVLYGVEVRARNREGSLNAPDKIIDNAEVVIGVVHSIPSEDGKGRHRPEEFTAEELIGLEYSISMALLDNDRVSVLGHPMSNYEKTYGRVPDAYYRNIILKARARGKAIEISAKYKNDFKGFLDLCLELDPLVSLGSDAHSVSELGMVSEKLHEVL